MYIVAPYDRERCVYFILHLCVCLQTMHVLCVCFSPCGWGLITPVLPSTHARTHHHQHAHPHTANGALPGPTRPSPSVSCLRARANWQMRPWPRCCAGCSMVGRGRMGGGRPLLRRCRCRGWGKARWASAGLTWWSSTSSLFCFNLLYVSAYFLGGGMTDMTGPSRCFHPTLV